jgi:hypothetical protein
MAFDEASLVVKPLSRFVPLISAHGSSDRRPKGAQETDAGPCRHAQTKSAPGR